MTGAAGSTTAGAVVCAGCGVELAPSLVACPACRKLVHGERLKALAAEAEVAEREGRLADALAAWRTATTLLPAASTQHAAVTKRITTLSQRVDRGEKPASPSAPGNEKKGAGGAAGLGALGVLAWKLQGVALAVLTKAKLLVGGLASLPTLLSMAAWLSLDRGRSLPFAVGLLVSIYVHEMGHVAALRAYGIAATAPMFLPGLGAVVRLKQYPADAREDARVGLAGPVWGTAAAIVAAGIGLATSSTLSTTALTVASFGATVNLFNLIPVWQLDGARGFRALDARQRGIVVAIAATAALVLDQKMAWGVCALGGLRLRSDLPRDAAGAPSPGDPRAFRTFAVLVALLAALAWAADKIK